jgi:hypothetical protein
MFKKGIMVLGMLVILVMPAKGEWIGFTEKATKSPPEIKVVKDDDSGITLEANIFGMEVKEVQGSRFKVFRC